MPEGFDKGRDDKHNTANYRVVGNQLRVRQDWRLLVRKEPAVVNGVDDAVSNIAAVIFIGNNVTGL